MSIQTKTLHEIQTKGLEALLRELGPVGMIRFLQQYETGHGDYSKDRHRLLSKPKVRTLRKSTRTRKSR